MADWRSELIIKMRDEGAKFNSPDMTIAEVKSLEPFVLVYNTRDIGHSLGDTIYMDNRMLDANIELDLTLLEEPQNIGAMTPQPLINITPVTPNSEYTATISGTQKQFLIDFYNFFKDYQKRYIIDIGDLVEVQKLKSNTYYIIKKVQKIEQ